MKKTYIFLLFSAAIMLLQACGPKSKGNENSVSIADSIANAEKADKAKVENEKAANDQARVERKRIADERRAKPTYEVSGVTVYNKTDVKPEFKGGKDAMNKYFKDNLKYPDGDTKWEGTVYVEFVVGADGKVQYAEIMDDTDPVADQSFRDEALRVVNNMPAWVPGKQSGKAVSVSYTLPISFQLL